METTESAESAEAAEATEAELSAEDQLSDAIGQSDAYNSTKMEPDDQDGEMGRLDMNKSAIKMQGSANTGT